MNQVPHEPILRSPPIVLGFCVGLLAIHAAIYVLHIADLHWLLSVFAFVPSQLGEAWKALINLITYVFLHGTWEHVILNVLWLLVFGTPVAIRLGTPWRFMGLFFLSAIGAALTHYIIDPDARAALIGASGGVAGMFGAAARFALPGMAWLNSEQARRKMPLMPLRQTFSRRPVVVFILVWLGLNIAFGVLSVSPSGAVVSIAWQAHIGGFFVGLLLLPLFEKPPISPSGGPGNVEYGHWSGS